MSMLTSLVLSCTYQCPIQCRYCGAECGPHQQERLTLSNMIELVDQVLVYGRLALVVFTGGEPFLLEQDILEAVKYCAGKHLATRIVTNAFWATSPSTARSKLQSLKEAGLKEINLSCDDYHQEFIPLERIKYANDACTELGMPCLIGHKIMKGYHLTQAHLEDYLGYPLAKFDPQKKNPQNNVISTGYTVPVAENMHLIPDDEILYPQSDASWLGPCSTILQRIIITPRRELSICCGMIRRCVPEIVFGPLGKRSLEELILEAQKDLIVNWLALEGPYGIMQFIQSKAPSISFRKRYVNICHLCSEIFTRPDCRSVLMEHGHEKICDVQLQRGLYDYVRSEYPTTSASESSPTV